MSDAGSVRAGLLTGLVALAGVLGAQEPPESLLEKSDIASYAPLSFRSRLTISPDREGQAPLEVEVWRKGEELSLVRFLDPKERGKFLVRVGDVMWFLSPGAKQPVKLPPAYRVRGSVTLDDILGIHYSRDYDIEGVAEQEDEAGTLVVFDLKANSKRTPYPRVRYVVRRASQRPVRAEYRLPSGKTSSVVEFLEWETRGRGHIRKLVVRERLRSVPPSEVEILEVEERTVPEGLFDLKDGALRAKLEAGEL